MITVTDTASKKIAQNLQRRGHGVGIRVGVRTTGCLGLAYVLEYIDDITKTSGAIDHAHDDFVIRIDQRDIAYLEGMTIDYVRQGLNEGFEFVNPNERDRCGCGESFRV